MILTYGQKIKLVRKRLNLKQSDIVNEEVSRNFISMIENDKSKPSYRVAQIIAEKANEACVKIGLDPEYTPEYFLETMEDQVKQKMQGHLDRLKAKEDSSYEVLEPLVEEAEAFFTEYSHYNLLPLASYLAGIYNQSKHFEKEYFIAFSAILASPPAFESSAYIELLINLTYCQIKLEKFEECQKYCNFALQNQEYFSGFQKYAFLYNRALSLLNLEKYHEVVDATYDVLKYFNLNAMQTIHIKTLCALAYIKIQRFRDAEKVLVEIDRIISMKDIDNKIMNVGNFLYLYGEQGDIYKAEHYYNICVSLLEKEEIDRIEKEKGLIKELFHAMRLLGKYEDAYALLKRVFKYCVDIAAYHRAIDTIDYLIELYQKNQSYKYLETAHDFFEIIVLEDASLPLIETFLTLQKAFYDNDYPVEAQTLNTLYLLELQKKHA